MFNILKPKGSFTTYIHCLACGHDFRREIKRIYVHMPAVTRKKPGGLSPYIIPEHITCPQCQAVDRYELARRTLNDLTLTLIAASIAGGSLAPGHAVQLITFGLYDGSVMHPLEAIEFYRQKVEKAPKDLAMRMRYGNTLRAIGWLDESEAQYQIVLAADPNQLEAWLSMASLHIARKHVAKAKKALAEIVKRAPGSKDPQWLEYQSQSQAYLDGIWPLADLTPDSLLLHSQTNLKKPRHKK